MAEMRPVTDAEFEPWLRAESRAHGNRLAHDPDELRPHFDLSRSLAVVEPDGSIVGGAHSHRREMSLPGGQAAIVAGVSNVAVQPTHRRRGLMTRMMLRQLQEVYERGETLAALFASESAIYGRFGYGVATIYETWAIDRPHTAYAQPRETPGQIRFIEPAAIGRELPDIFRRSTIDRPGVFPKPAYKWQEEANHPEHSAGGRGGRFYAVYAEAGRDEGYASYRTAEGTLIVQELMAATANAAAALWRFCFDLDLISSAKALRRPGDDPLPWMLADPRRLQRTPRDGLWLRLVDAAAALQLRSYPQSGRLNPGTAGMTPAPGIKAALRWKRRRRRRSAIRLPPPPDLTLPVDALGRRLPGRGNFQHPGPSRPGRGTHPRRPAASRRNVCQPYATLDALRVFVGVQLNIERKRLRIAKRLYINHIRV